MNDIHIFSTDCMIMNSLSLVRIGMHDPNYPNVLYLLVISSNISMPFGFCILSGVVLGPHYLLLFYLADLEPVYLYVVFLRFWCITLFLRVERNSSQVCIHTTLLILITQFRIWTHDVKVIIQLCLDVYVSMQINTNNFMNIPFQTWEYISYRNILLKTSIKKSRDRFQYKLSYVFLSHTNFVSSLLSTKWYSFGTLMKRDQPKLLKKI